MINIRTSVFETNSSSTHSISIASNADGILGTIVPNDEGVIILTGGEFGWAWDKFNDAITKANYCAVDAAEHAEHSHMLAEVLAEHTGAKKIVFAIDDGSYIDHDSTGASGEAFQSPEKLKDFIFNSKSWLFTGNDNDDSPPNFYDVEDDIVYTYELKMDGIDFSTKFSEKPSPSDVEEAAEKMAKKHPATIINREDFEDYIDHEPYMVYPYDLKLYDETIVNSLNKIDQGLITLYRVERMWQRKESSITKSNREGLAVKGDAVMDSIDISFQLIPIE